MGKLLDFKDKFTKIKNVDFLTKLIFLFEQTYQFYSDFHKMRIGSSVDIHYELYARRDTIRQIWKIIKERRVTRSFNKRVRQLLVLNRLQELKYYGII